MTTFDLAEVRSFSAELDARMNRCDNGEGMHCANLNDALFEYARLCCEMWHGIREWGRAVFTGRVAFDPEVEKVFIEKGAELYRRSFQLLSYGQKNEVPCYTLSGQSALQASLWSLGSLFQDWVTPKLAVGPAARHKRVSPEVAENIRQKLELLPPLPSDWQPSDARQQELLRKITTPQPYTDPLEDGKEYIVMSYSVSLP